MKKIIEFLFFRWKREVVEEGTEKWQKDFRIGGAKVGEPIICERDFVRYKFTNKFDGSVKIKKVYLN